MPRHLKIDIILATNRLYSGYGNLVDVQTGEVLYGPFEIIGRSSRSWPDGHGGRTQNQNTTLDSLHKDGNTPTGEYRVTTFAPNGGSTGRSVETYGPHGVFVLDPSGGDALIAKNNGRVGLYIHSGHRMPDGSLMSTEGCLRMGDDHIKGLYDAVMSVIDGGPNPVCEVTTVTTTVGTVGSLLTEYEEGDPPAGLSQATNVIPPWQIAPPSPPPPPTPHPVDPPSPPVDPVTPHRHLLAIRNPLTMTTMTTTMMMMATVTVTVTAMGTMS
ncbi:L,D-transpeptidase [Cupriavidus basilensis]